MTTPRPALRTLSALVYCVVLTGCGRFPTSTHAAPSLTNALAGDTFPVRDPSIAFENGRYFLYSTDPRSANDSVGYLPVRCSADRVTWSLCGHVFADLPAWVKTALPHVRSLWAPDVSYFNGLYHLYYCASSLGSQESVIGVATNRTLDPANAAYRWVDRGQVIASRSGDDFNAIDPNIVVTSDHTVWLTYGSFWSGVKQRRIDPSSGLLSTAETHRYDLADTRSADAEVVEGASILQHGPFFYLFLSKGLCCEANIERNNYREIVGRSRSANGPYLDEAGKPLLRGGGTLVKQPDIAWAAPGGASAFHDPVTARDLLVFHALQRSHGGQPTLRIEPIQWTRGWPILRKDQGIGPPQP